MTFTTNAVKIDFLESAICFIPNLYCAVQLLLPPCNFSRPSRLLFKNSFFVIQSIIYWINVSLPRHQVHVLLLYVCTENKQQIADRNYHKILFFCEFKDTRIPCMIHYYTEIKVFIYVPKFLHKTQFVTNCIPNYRIMCIVKYVKNKQTNKIIK